MKKGFIKGAWGSAFKKVAIATFALAVLFIFNVTAVYADDAQEQDRGRIRTEREERILLRRSIRESLELEQGRGRRAVCEERILLLRGIREGLELEHGQGRRRIVCEDCIMLLRGIREGLELEQGQGRRSIVCEDRIMLRRSIREGLEFEHGQGRRTEREERILLPRGIRESRTELDFERSGTRWRTERESRNTRNGLRNAS